MKLKHIKSLFGILLLLINNLLWAQDPVFVHLGEEEGLPDIEFYNIIEDNDGFVWLAANRGLFRYDGKEFKKYSNPQKRGFSVFNLNIDEKGQVWCNNLSGQFFYVKNDSLKLFIDIRDKVYNAHLPDFFITQDYLKISLDKGLLSVNRKTKKETLKEYHQKVTPDVFSINNQTYFLGKDLLIFNEKDEVINKVELKKTIINKRFFFFHNSLFLHYKLLDKESVLIPSSRGTAFLEKIEEGVLRKIFLPDVLREKRIIEIVQIDQELWFCTAKGVFICRYDNNKLSLSKSFLKEEYITKVLKDKWNNIWVTTLSNGVYVIPNRGILKKSMPLEIGDKVTSINFSNEFFISGTKKGLLILEHLESKKKTTLKIDENIGEIKKLTVDKTSTNLIVEGEYKMILLDLKKNRYRKKKSAVNKQTSFLSNHTLLISTYKDFYLMNLMEVKSTTQGQSISAPILLKDSIGKRSTSKYLSKRRSYNHYVSTSADIYESGSGILTYYDRKNAFEAEEITFKGKSIFAIHYTETEDGIVWFSTTKYGVLGVKGKEVVYQYDKIKNPLFDEPSKILADGNNLWIATSTKLHYVDRERESIASFSFRNEIPVQKIIDLKRYKDKLYILGNKEVIVVDKSLSMEESLPPKVNFSEINYGKLKRKIKDHYSVPYDENSFEIKFNSNEFNSKNTITYLYRLKGLEEDWKSTIVGEVRYPSIPFGDYIFELKAKDLNGIESSTIKQIEIKIQKPFWAEWWFIAFVLLFSFGMIFLRIRKIKKNQNILLTKEQLDKDLVLSRLENLRVQMNPHFIFNALNSIQNYILKSDKITASLYLSDFSELIRMYLDHSRKTEIKLVEELSAMEKYLKLESIRFGKRLHHEIEIEEGVDVDLMKIPPLLIQPYVENSLKHGLFYKKKECILKLVFGYCKENNTLICSVNDNGIGRKKAMEMKGDGSKRHISFATKANDDRISLLNKNRDRKIIVQTIDLFAKEKIQGTKVILTIPQ